MYHENYDSSASGYLPDSFEGISQTFTDVEILATSEVNVVAKAKRYGRWWLLKGLRKEVAGEAGYQQRLRKEFEILMQLQHPGVVMAVGLEDVEVLGLCIVMEYVDGVTLKEWLTEKPTRQMRLRVMQEITDAVSYLHTKGIVHRDLKPTNIIVTGNGSHVKLIDFGLADTNSHTILKQPAGTPTYMSPEQMQTAVADGRNDIYSLGIIMQQMELGWRYHYIINRCLRPIEQRYQQMGDLQHAIHSTNSRIRNVAVWLGALLIMALILLIGLQVRRAKEQDERLVAIHATYQQQLGAQQQKLKQLVDSTTELRLYNQQQRQKEIALKTSRKKVEDAISKGKALIDKTMRQTNIDKHLDTLTNILYIWSDFTYRCQSGERAIENYLKQMDSSFSDTEKDEIRNAMYRHNEAIVTKWKNRIVNISK
jgi:Kae1-associated kinase Bud32